MPSFITIETSDDLHRAVREAIARDGPACNLNHLRVHNITSFANLFQGTGFCGDVSQWTVRNADSMSEMFEGTPFNGDIQDWNVSKLSNATRMFANSAFNQDISIWNVQRLLSSQMFEGMFENTSFSHDLSSWDFMEMLEKSQCSLFGLVQLLRKSPGVVPGHLVHRLEQQHSENTKSNGLEALKNYVRLFGSTQDLEDYYHRTPFGMMHFDACAYLGTYPNGIQEEDYAWSREVVLVGTGLGLKRSELRAFAKEQLALRGGLGVESFEMDGL